MVNEKLIVWGLHFKLRGSTERIVQPVVILSLSLVCFKIVLLSVGYLIIPHILNFSKVENVLV